MSHFTRSFQYSPEHQLILTIKKKRLICNCVIMVYMKTETTVPERNLSFNYIGKNTDLYIYNCQQFPCILYFKTPL